MKTLFLIFGFWMAWAMIGWLCVDEYFENFSPYSPNRYKVERAWGYGYIVIFIACLLYGVLRLW